MAHENVVILGATSGIARALCQVMAQRGCRLIVAGRNEDELTRIASDLRVRNQTDAFVERFDALDFDDHVPFLDRCRAKLGGPIDGVVLCYGYMTEQSKTQEDFEAARRTIDVNFTSAISILGAVANEMESRGSGYIAAISSVAGDRGRQSNYTYGASKAGLSAFLGGLRNRLCKSGVHVLEVRPGFVDTPMTHGLVDPDSPLVASPERVAKAIDAAIVDKRDVIYAPWFWRGIMKTIRSIPESVFKRLKL